MKKHSRITDLILLLLGVIGLFANLSKPRIDALHGADILGLIACGMCFGVALVGLMARLRTIHE